MLLLAAASTAASSFTGATSLGQTSPHTTEMFRVSSGSDLESLLVCQVADSISLLLQQPASWP